ncbi:MAG TPA: DUF1450 domain-containing protein [Firmicutes bacterium]|nr:DUF1450 domain-containing protein [Bacillota bacterium]
MFDLDSLFAEPNEFRVCDKCKGTNINTLLPKLKAVDPKAKIFTGCQSYCGPGRDRPFVFVNNKPIIADNEAELIEKVKTALGK